MPRKIIEARAVNRVERQIVIFQVLHPQSLAFEHAPNALTDESNQALKRSHGRRWHPAKDQPVARRHIYAV